MNKFRDDNLTYNMKNRTGAIIQNDPIFSRGRLKRGWFYLFFCGETRGYKRKLI
jgi:hypothetical protein